MKLKIERLKKEHNKNNFDCENTQLNNYFKTQAKQDVNKDLSVCYVLNDIEKDKVVGFYTLSSSSIPRYDLPDSLVKKLPTSYGDLPTILIGRLAIDKTYKGLGYGQRMLLDSFKRIVNLSNELGSLAIVVDPIDENAIRFYEKYGFILIPSTNKMFIPIKTIESLFLKNGNEQKEYLSAL